MTLSHNIANEDLEFVLRVGFLPFLNPENDVTPNFIMTFNRPFGQIQTHYFRLGQDRIFQRPLQLIIN
jgi:hypothetical protein